jgi:hypothetical protein
MKFLHRCWCLLLGALLPNACTDSGVDPAPEYGVPQATLKLDGVVVDSRGAPVKDILIELDNFGSTTSDALGGWSMVSVGFDSCVIDTLTACGLVASDPAGPGMYMPTLVNLDLVQTAPGSGFNLGTYEQHSIRIVMDDVAVEYGPECAKAAYGRKKLDEYLSPERTAN